MASENIEECKWDGCSAPASLHVIHYDSQPTVIGAEDFNRMGIGQTHTNLCDEHILELKKIGKGFVGTMPLGRCNEPDCPYK